MDYYLTDSAGRRKRAKYITCDSCGNEFLKQVYYIGKTKNNFCCRECVYAFQRKDRVQLVCTTCKTPFTRSVGRLKKSIHGIYFCNRECRDKGQRIEANLKKLWPSHYCAGKHVDYRKLALSELPNKCNKCGVEHPLVVHHKDRNKGNNFLSNLEILCPNCHYIEHMRG